MIVAENYRKSQFATISIRIDKSRIPRQVTELTNPIKENVSIRYTSIDARDNDTWENNRRSGANTRRMLFSLTDAPLGILPFETSYFLAYNLLINWISCLDTLPKTSH